jgi:hypothetical protein
MPQYNSLILIYISKIKSVQKCSKVFKSVQKCSKVFKSVQGVQGVQTVFGLNFNTLI